MSAMRKTTFLTILFTLLCCCANAQTIDDFNKDSVRKAKLTYDENFNPTVNLSLRNISSKTITSIEETVYYSNPDNPYDIHSSYQEQKIVQIPISPNTTKSTQFRISKPRNNYIKIIGYMISRIRYQDGTICQ